MGAAESVPMTCNLLSDGKTLVCYPIVPKDVPDLDYVGYLQFPGALAVDPEVDKIKGERRAQRLAAAAAEEEKAKTDKKSKKDKAKKDKMDKWKPTGKWIAIYYINETPEGPSQADLDNITKFTQMELTGANVKKIIDDMIAKQSGQQGGGTCKF